MNLKTKMLRVKNRRFIGITWMMKDCSLVASPVVFIKLVKTL